VGYVGRSVGGDFSRARVLAASSSAGFEAPNNLVLFAEWRQRYVDRSFLLPTPFGQPVTCNMQTLFSVFHSLLAISKFLHKQRLGRNPRVESIYQQEFATEALKSRC
jgi:hypothetical protein